MTYATLLIALIAMPAGDRTADNRPAEPVLLYFTSANCGYCRQMAPAIDLLVQKNYPVKKVSLDRSPEMGEKYEITGVPVCVVVDPNDGTELARIPGAQSAARVAQFYLATKQKFLADRGITPAPRTELDRSGPRARDALASTDEDEGEAAADGSEPEPSRTAVLNPKPWETVVRIKVYGQGSIGFGSGTVIESSPAEAIILTCAHIFKLEGPRQATPRRFPRRVTVDLFDGKLRGGDTRGPGQVRYQGESYEAEVIDYDFDRDVGLIRIRPGRRLPFARVVPPGWSPSAGNVMLAVGCPEGQDATAWKTTVQNPRMKGLAGNPAYEAIECNNAPKQGRSGGGLFTMDGYIAGVCDFAEPRGNHGLYATPRSIQSFLDRNQMTALYDSRSERRPGALLADADRPVRKARNTTVARGQSPEAETARPITMPPTYMFGLDEPRIAARAERPGRGRQSWHPSAAAGTSPADETDTTDLKLDRSLDPDHFSAPGSAPTPSRSADEPEADDESETRIVSPQRPGTDQPTRVKSGKSKWRAVRTAAGPSHF